MDQNSADVTADWVEIIEPTSKERVFTNRTTGEIVLVPPPGAAVKPMTQNQWWELLDSTSKCLYYYNPHTEQTVWNKPTDPTADIISFTKLQTVPIDKEDLDQPTNIDQFDPAEDKSTLLPQQRKTPEPLPSLESTAKTPPSDSHEAREGSTERKVSDIFAPPQQLRRLSPMNLFNDTRFSFASDVPLPGMDSGPPGTPSAPSSQLPSSEQQRPKNSSMHDTNHTSHKSHQKLGKAMSMAGDGMSRDDKCMTLDSAMLKNRPQHSTEKKPRGRLGSVGPAPPPPAPKPAAKPSSPASPEEVGGGAASSLPNPPSSTPTSTTTVEEGRPTEPPVPATSAADDQLPTPPVRKKKAASVDNGVDFNLPLAHKSVKINDPKAHLVPSPSDLKAPGKEVPSPSDLKAPGKEVPSPSDLKAPGKEDVQPSPDTEKGVVPNPKAGAAGEGKAVGIPTEQRSVRKSLHHNRAKSDIIPAPPPAPSFMSSRASTIDRSVDPSVTKAVQSIGSFEDLAQHKKGLFRKKVTIHNMLSWTKDPIKEPMIMTRDKQTRKDAVEIFKLILQYMGDRRPKKDPLQTALEIVTRGWENKNVRDEIYIQLCRQTSANDKPASAKCGWELFTICLAFFPPTVKFRSYLEGYLYKHIAPSEEHMGVPVEVYAQYCHKKVEKMTQMGAKKGLKKPTLEEVIHSKDAPFNPSMFGMSLEEIIEQECAKVPNHNGIPWVVQVLVDTVLKLGGPQTEGIFRVPGDIDEVNSLLLHVDKGLPPPDSLSDPHIPASLLKLWFRELEEPLIPESYYQECVDNYDKRPNAISLVKSLPDRNRELLLFIIRFLRKFTIPENVEATKMTLDNIAMVWAPNFLRCPSEDHALIFQNTKKEMGFLRLLLKYVETEERANAEGNASETREAPPDS